MHIYYSKIYDILYQTCSTCGGTLECAGTSFVDLASPFPGG